MGRKVLKSNIYSKDVNMNYRVSIPEFQADLLTNIENGATFLEFQFVDDMQIVRFCRSLTPEEVNSARKEFIIKEIEKLQNELKTL